jgi:serine phosphatase RsbU (regulator of sigma subunit)
MMIKNIINKILLLILLDLSICFGQQDFISKEEIGKPFINYYSPKVYKSNGRNWVVAQDTRGIMYFANETGVLEYDGHYWRKIKVPQDKMVRSISIDERDKIYVCADIDLGYLKPDSKGELKYVSLLPFLEKKYHNFGEVSDVKTIDNYAYFKTKDKIFRWDGNNFTVWDLVFSFRLHNLNDKIYVMNEGIGLMTIEGDELKLIPDGDFFSSKCVNGMLPYGVSNVGVDSILILTYEHGLFLYDYKKFSKFETEADEYLIENQINNATVTSDGNYAFATQRGGIVIINKYGKLVKIIDEKSGLQTNVCFDVFSDKNGGLWLTTEYGINHIIEPSSLSSFQNSGELKNISNSIFRYKNRIYAATELGPMILESNDEGFQLLRGDNQPSSVFAEFDDKLLVGTSSGTFVIENKSITKKIVDEITTCILVSDYFPGRIYLGTYDGFSILEKRGNQFKIVYKKELPDEVINIIEEKDGSLWINGFFPGLISVTGNLKELSNGQDNAVTYQSFDNSNKLNANVFRIVKILNSSFFIADEGVYKYDKIVKTFEKYSSFGEVLSDASTKIVLIVNGNNDSIWVLAYFQGEPVMGRAALQSNGTYNWEPIPELSLLDLATVISIYPDKDPLTGNEKLWLSTEEELVLYDPSIETSTLSNYSTLIRKVEAKRDTIIFFGANNFEVGFAAEIDYSKNDIIFEYSATHYDKPNLTYFQTYLEGDDEEWSSWSLETKKEYTNLSHGDYVFKVKAKNLYGIESDLASYSFTILAPWYLSWWAYILYALFIVGTLSSIRKFELDRRDKNNRIRISELKAEAAEFQAQAAETQARLIQADNDRKTKELEEARQLQLSMLPKEIPELPHLDIAVYMKTATEVGGDYYDFSTKYDGSLNIAVGDATGHGMQAGTLVTIIKGLFTSEASKRGILEFFSDASRTIKDINMGRLMMAFSLIKLNGKNLEYSGAGMPPMYIYRKESNKIDEIDMQGMPLGAMKNFKYNLYETELIYGDCVLLLSDGYPELANDDNEQIGYERLQNQLLKMANKKPEEIIEYFKNFGSEWVNGKEPDDDVTFVVVKVKT